MQSIGARRFWVLFCITATMAVAACGGGGGSSTTGAGINNPPPVTNVTVSGRVTFARIPLTATVGNGLDYAGTRQDPSRGVVVDLLNATTQAVIASGATDANGNYSFATVPGNTSVQLRVTARMVRAAPAALPRWDFAVRDVDTTTTNYSYSDGAFSSGSGVTHDVAIPSGWNTASRTATGPRESAPFAILDTLYRAYTFVLATDADADFPALVVDWSAENTGGETFYQADPEPLMVLPGEADVDTDEFDEHVIAHEFGHYLEDSFARSDSDGGAHAVGDYLDPRVAWGEGFAYAFAAMVLNESEIRDVFGAGQADDQSFNVENDSLLNEGWFSEASIQEIVWDLFDSANDHQDTVSLGFGPIWNVLTNEQKVTPAVTSLFSFVTNLKVRNAGQAAQIDQLVLAENVASTSMDAFGTGETNDAGATTPSDVLAVHTVIGIDAGPTVIRSTNSLHTGFVTGTDNKLSNSRFIRLDVGPAAANLRITATGPAPRDIDIDVYRLGNEVMFGRSDTNEQLDLTLDPGTYLLDVYDCGNAECNEQSPMPVDMTVTVETR